MMQLPANPRIRGNGPTIIFAHGTFMDDTMFDPQLDYVASRGWRGIAYNSRAMTDPEEIHDLEDLAEDCLDLADQHGVGNFVLCGMSMGAFMGIEFALKHQDRLLGLVMIDGKAAAYSAEERAAFAPRFGSLDRDGPISLEFAEWVAPLCFGRTTAATNPELIDHWVQRWTTVTPARSVHRQYLSWIDRPDRRERLSEITVPALLFHGAEDVPTPLTHSIGMMEQLPDATLVKVPGAGHTSNLERPDIVNQALGAFLERVGGVR
jgi:pimeloyl-ACP methyl ester carboxylesterase